MNLGATIKNKEPLANHQQARGHMFSELCIGFQARTQMYVKIMPKFKKSLKICG